MISNSGCHLLDLPDILNSLLFFKFPFPLMNSADESHVSTTHFLSRKMITLQSKQMHVPLPSLFSVSVMCKGRRGQPLLSGRMRPKFDVALLCQTCQEWEMDSYQGRSCTGQGWRGGADSGLTAAINHLQHQPGCRLTGRRVLERIRTQFTGDVFLPAGPWWNNACH